MKIESKHIEKIVLVLFFALMLYIAFSALFEQRLSHDYPLGYKASDTFQHQIRAESIKEMGNYRYEAPYIAAGFDNVVGFYPPVMYHISAIFSHATGLESYDAAYFMVIFFTILCAFVMYYLIRRLNKNIAIMSLPLMLLVFTGKFFSGITWGQWPFFVASFFLLCSVWVLAQINLKKTYVLLGLFLSATALTHTSEFIFGAVFIALYLFITFLMKKLTVKNIKKLFLAGIIFVILTSYFLVIFQGTWMKSQPYQFRVEPTISNFKNVFLKDFSWMLFLIAIGVFLMLLFFYKKQEPVMLFSGFMLLAGFTNYVGFGMRAFQTRFLWPVYLSVFFGLTLQQALRFVIKKKTLFYVIISILLMILFITGIPNPFVNPFDPQSSEDIIEPFYEPSSGGLMNSYHWQAIEWIKEETNPDDTIFFFYSQLFHGQSSLDYNTKRQNHLIDFAEMQRDANSGIISRQYSSWIPYDGGAGLPYRTGVLSFGYYAHEQNLTFFDDVCSYDYYVFDKVGYDTSLVDYNMFVASRFLENNMSLAFNNDVTIILKNNEIGGDCIAG